MINIHQAPFGLEDFPPFLQHPTQLSLNKMIDSWINNIITLGFRNSSELILKERKIELLKKHQISLQLEITNNRACFAPLMLQIENISEAISHSKSVNEIDADLKKLETDLNGINFHPLSLNQSVTPLAMETLTILGYILSNILTVGFYGVIKAVVLQKQIDLLTAQNAHLTAKTQTVFDKAKDLLLATVAHLTNHVQINRGNILFKASPSYQLYLNTQKLKEEITVLKKQNSAMINELHLLCMNEKNLKDKIGSHPQMFDGQIEALKETLNEIDAQIVDQQAQLLGVLPSRYTGYESDLKIYEAFYDKNKKLDPLLAGDYGIGDNEIEKANYTPYVKIANAETSHTPDGLVKGIFNHIFDQQVVLRPWLQSEQMSAVAQREKRIAFYSLMALELIRCSRLIKVDCHGYGLKLGKDDLMILAPSLPERVQRSLVKGQAPVQTAIIFKRLNNPFTPPMDDPELPYGIDPVAAALIYRMNLTKQEQRFVEILLAESLTVDDDSDLLAGKEALNGPNGDLIRLAVDLVSEVGCAIEKNFGLMLDAEWLIKKADEQDAMPVPVEKAPH